MLFYALERADTRLFARSVKVSKTYTESRAAYCCFPGDKSRTAAGGQSIVKTLGNELSKERSKKLRVEKQKKKK